MQKLHNARGKGIPRLEISITECDRFTDIPDTSYDAVFNPFIRRPDRPRDPLKIFSDILIPIRI